MKLITPILLILLLASCKEKTLLDEPFNPDNIISDLKKLKKQELITDTELYDAYNYAKLHTRSELMEADTMTYREYIQQATPKQ